MSRINAIQVFFLFTLIFVVNAFFSGQIVVLNISVLLALTSHIPSKSFLSVLNRTLKIICLVIFKCCLKYDNILTRCKSNFGPIVFIQFDFKLFKPILPLLASFYMFLNSKCINSIHIF